jgi:hypothetical protein
MKNGVPAAIRYTYKDKRYPVLGFHRGDVQVILGLRQPMTPKVIAAYATSLLAHDTHRVGHTGGGGSGRSVSGLPFNPRQATTQPGARGAHAQLYPLPDGTTEVAPKPKLHLTARRTGPPVQSWRCTSRSADPSIGLLRTFGAMALSQQAERVNLMVKLVTPEVFWRRVEVRGPDECHLYVGPGTRTRDGHVRISVAGRKEYAHRYAYFLVTGVWPYIACHTCDTPRCVRVDPGGSGHVYNGTPQTNVRDRDERQHRRPPLRPHHWSSRLSEQDLPNWSRLSPWASAPPC